VFDVPPSIDRIAGLAAAAKGRTRTLAKALRTMPP
jgi:hypothetical protein